MTQVPISSGHRNFINIVQPHMREGRFRKRIRKYLPLSSISNLVTVNIIRDIVKADKDLAYELGQSSKLIQKIHDDALQIFTVSVLANIPAGFIHSCIEIGFRDSKFPFHHGDFPAKGFERKHVEQFLSNQSIVLKNVVPSFLSDTVLNGIPCGTPIFLATNTNCGVPIEATDEKSKALGEGASAIVFKGQVDKDLYNLTELPPILPQSRLSIEVAIKQFKSLGLSQWSTEHRFIKRMAEYRISDARLTQFYGGFTVRNMDQKGENSVERYLISELADYSLKNVFMNFDKEFFRHDLPEHPYVWMLREMQGLASALDLIHLPKTKVDKAGCHHDIKPENILLFKRNSTVVLKFTDWGCATFTDRIINGNGNHDCRLNKNFGQVPFNAPESKFGNGASQPHDIWSLGCVFVLLLVWFLEGYKSCEQFYDKVFYEINKNNERNWFKVDDRNVFCIKVTVQEKLKELEDSKEEDLTEVVACIRKMLKLKPGERPTAKDCATELEQLLRHAESSHVSA